MENLVPKMFDPRVFTPESQHQKSHVKNFGPSQKIPQGYWPSGYDTWKSGVCKILPLGIFTLQKLLPPENSPPRNFALWNICRLRVLTPLPPWIFSPGKFLPSNIFYHEYWSLGYFRNFCPRKNLSHWIFPPNSNAWVLIILCEVMLG